MKNKTLKGMVMVMLLGALSGCSTIHNGNFEKIKIISTPSKALCRIYRESEGYMKSVATPNAVYIHRSTEPIRIVCSKEGYRTAEVIATPSYHANLMANAANYEPIAVFVGGLIDISNASNTDLPEVVSVTLEAK